MSAASFFIPTLPGLSSTSTLSMYGGHIPSAPPLDSGLPDTSNDAHLYFFLIRNRHIADTPRTIIWFNGGPGCSSFDGSFMEVGPIRMVPGGNGELEEVEGAWNEYANIIFVDQPAGTGYSYVSTDNYVHELPAMAQHVVEFMRNFYTIFPELSQHDTYLAGESYAGQYIPYIASAILKTTRIQTHLKGLLIGNGWVDPLNQYPAYLDFALESGIVARGSTTETNIRQEVDTCVAQLTKDGIENVKVHDAACEHILTAITESTLQSVNGLKMCVNNYDVRLTDTYPACGMNWPLDLSDLTPYLQRPEVKAAFHATKKEGGWMECSGQVGSNFWAETSKPSVTLLPNLLQHVPILMFAGDQDLICNHVGLEKMIENLEWNGEKGFGNETEALEWRVNGKHAGTWTTARNLTYVRVADASHMVPYDQPLASHDMLLRFLGVELLGAAGPAAQVPSRVGAEQEAVLGETHPNGTAVTHPSLSGKDPVSVTSPMGMEALISAGSALVIVLLILVGIAAFYFLARHRPRSMKFSRRNRGRGGGGGSGGGGAAQMRQDEDSRLELQELVREEEAFGLGEDEDEEDERERGGKDRG